MEFKIALLIFGLTLAVSLKESHGTKCYQCANCPDPFNKNAQGVTVKDCPSLPCMKTKVDGNVARSCAPGTADDECKTTSVQGKDVTVCVCNSDQCNSATTSTISVTAALSLVAGIFVIKRLL